MAYRAAIIEAELQRYVSHYAAWRVWHRADRRTSEGRAQELALTRGWIEPVPPGSGYRVVSHEQQSPTGKARQTG